MDPRRQFCQNPDRPDRGQRGRGNMGVPSPRARRYRYRTCGQTFAATKGTPFYRLRTAGDGVAIVLTLLCPSCPLHAIVAAFGWDERTVGPWSARAGGHCQQVHRAIVEQGQVDLGHVQADELWVKWVAKRVWMAMAVPLAPMARRSHQRAS
jgi:hypothetical protein